MQTETFLAIARQFGTALDNDDFALAKSVLAESCTYGTGKGILRGPQAIVESYERNMLDGRKKLDELTWGKSTAELREDGRVAVHFTDYLKHRGVEHTHRCQQLLTPNDQNEIAHIEHRALSGEPEKLKSFYESVGLA